MILLCSQLKEVMAVFPRVSGPVARISPQGYVCKCSAGLTIVAMATGPTLLGAPRSSGINLIYYIICKNLFTLGSQETSILLNLP